MNESDVTEDVDVLIAAATVFAARRRLRAALGPLVEDRHRVPTPPGADPTALDDLLGAEASVSARMAWDHLAAALADHNPADHCHS